MINNDKNLFSNVGIDSIGFHTPRYFVDIAELARKRSVDPAKYEEGLMLKEMRIPGDEDIVSMSLKAGHNAITKGKIDPREIDAIFVGTETMTYAVKSVSNILADLLGVSQNSITQDVYNACAGGTLAIFNAVGMVQNNLINNALVIAADISSYEIGSPSEPTQGSGAAALIISKNPRVAEFSRYFGKMSGNVNDFFRPAGEKNAQVFGHYSVKSYLDFQLGAYDDLVKNIGKFNADFYSFHAPFAKMPLKAVQHILEKRWLVDTSNMFKGMDFSALKTLDSFMQSVPVITRDIYDKIRKMNFSPASLDYVYDWVTSSINSKVTPQLRVPSHFGNMYSASVWAQIMFILENHAMAGSSIYFGSYGSGATCLTGLLNVKSGFKKIVGRGRQINDYINDKVKVTVPDYESMKTSGWNNDILLGRVVEHEENYDRGFTLHFCDEGCLIPSWGAVNYCPKGHSGFHEIFFPLYAVLDTKPISSGVNDLSFLKKGLVNVPASSKKGSELECEIRRIAPGIEEDGGVRGLLNWAPMYLHALNIC